MQTPVLFQQDLASIQEPRLLDADCGKGPKTHYVTMRHIESNGIGYNQGYTTLEGFFHPADFDSWIPFLDVRGHLFNNGRPAANVGLGIRRLVSSRIWGMNGYYDYRKTKRQHYNQFCLGLESLGTVWDFRINGYLPLGDKKSKVYGAPRFDAFKGHYAYISRKFEFAMKGANAEVGAHINYKDFPMYVAAGPYYLEGQGKVAWGGQARIALDLWHYVRLEGNTSYDNVFKWIGQGQISIVVPLGGKKEVHKKKQRSCKDQMSLARRAVQRIERIEIIPVDTKKSKEVAIDPLTGQPYFFWFVNSGGSSDGSFESPYPTLDPIPTVSSPHDIIYVFSGRYDTSTINNTTGLTLQDNQKLFGSGTDQILQTTVGKLTIPALTSELPQISNSYTSDPTIVTSANNNEIAGLDFIVLNGGDGIDVINRAHPFIHDNIFDLGVDRVGAFGIYLYEFQEEAQIIDNQFNYHNLFGAFGINMPNNFNATEVNCFIANNSFTNFSANNSNNTCGLLLNFYNAGTVNITHNQFTRLSRGSILLNLSGTESALNINDNIFSQNNPDGQGDIFVELNDVCVFRMSNNMWINSVNSVGSYSLQYYNSSTPNCISLQGNLSDFNPGYQLTANTYPLTTDISNNIGSVEKDTEAGGSFVPGSCP